MMLSNEKYNSRIPFFLMVIMAIMFFSTDSFAQAAKQADSTAAPKIYFKSNPKRAAIYSAICPGLGQIYNRKYWKLPIVYGGIGSTIYFIGVNYSGYSNVRNGIAQLQDNDITNDNLPIWVKDYTLKKYDLKANGATVDDLLKVKKYFRQNLDYSVLAAVAIYLLNIADANVDAHLSGFNMSDNLTLTPIINQQGVGVAFNIK